MTPPPEPPDWQTWYDRLAALQAVECRLVHEQIITDAGLVRRRSLGTQEALLERRGLCPLAMRRTRLGCAHTMARYPLEEAVQALAQSERLPSGAAARLLGEVRTVSQAIHSLDHRKGDLEKQLALAREQLHLAPPSALAQAARFALEKGVASMQTDLLGMEETHTGYVREMDRLRRLILSYLRPLLHEAIPE